MFGPFLLSSHALYGNGDMICDLIFTKKKSGFIIYCPSFEVLIKVLNTRGWFFFFFFFNATVDNWARSARHQSSDHCRCRQWFKTEMTFKENAAMRSGAALWLAFRIVDASRRWANRGQELPQLISARQPPINEQRLDLEHLESITSFTVCRFMSDLDFPFIRFTFYPVLCYLK